MDSRDGYHFNQRVTITAGAYRGRQGIVWRRYFDPQGDGILYEVKLAEGDNVVLPSDVIEAIGTSGASLSWPAARV